VGRSALSRRGGLGRRMLGLERILVLSVDGLRIVVEVTYSLCLAFPMARR
jgi:hypothetical protein